MLEPRAPKHSWKHSLQLGEHPCPGNHGTHCSTYYAARGTCSILDIAFAKNLILEDINSVNDLSSDHNPVLIDLALNNSLPKNLRTLKSTNWIKFQEIVFNSIPGNPIIDTNNIDNAINNFTGMITSAISATTVTKVISTPHLRLPHRIRELIKIKNRFRKQWQLTRNPLLKREVNSLQRQIKTQISEHRNNSWHNLLTNLHPEDNSLYNLQRKLVKKPTIIPRWLAGTASFIRTTKKPKNLKTISRLRFKKMRSLTTTKS
ncbi:RNA-directed DNA polymerase from mobile element jockey [Trichonephila clavipes]|nr:RNA-directed DNA polymerase from mobile element jockey [Trichonephila clavipes]